MRPTRIDEVIGQAHLLGPGKPLRLAFEAGKFVPEFGRERFGKLLRAQR
jgi:replication-associated recombination protein RarA